MARKFSNFRLLTNAKHFFGAQAVIDIESHGRVNTVLITLDKRSNKWRYLSGSGNEVNSSAISALQIPDDLSQPFWYDARDNDLVDFAKWVSRATSSLAAQLENNSTALSELRRGGLDDLNERAQVLTEQRERLRGAVRELMSVMSKMTYTL